MAMDLEARVARLEDIEAIRALKMRYCDLCDRGYDADSLMPLFTEEAVWDGGRFGRYEGARRIRRFFEATGGIVRFAKHYVTNSVVEVEGDRASGRWYLLQAATMPGEAGERAVWGAARYDERYARTTEGWKFESIVLDWDFWTPFDEGWARTRAWQPERGS
jgi:ketosteroid isomerase-like protein